MMSSVIMPAGSSTVDLNTLLAVLSSPADTASAVKQLAAAAKDSKVAANALQTKQTEFNREKSFYEKDKQTHLEFIEASRNELHMRDKELAAAINALVSREKALEDRDLLVSHREQVLLATEANSRDVNSALAKKEEALKIRENDLYNNEKAVANQKLSLDKKSTQLKSLLNA